MKNNILEKEWGGGTDTALKKRNSNLELFRIISMFCIIAHHYIVNSGIIECITPQNALLPKSIFAVVFGWGGKTGINCFVLITGYYMCKSNITLKKYLKLLFEVEYYNILFYIIFMITQYEPFDIIVFTKRILLFYNMNNGFTGAYLVFFLFIPFLNLLISSMNEKQHRYLVGLCLLVGSVLKTLLNVADAFNYIGWFCVLYFIASYIRCHSDGEYENIRMPSDFFNDKVRWRKCTCICLGISWCSVLFGTFIYTSTGKKLIYYFVADSNKLMAVVTAISAFLFWKNYVLKYSKIINTIAASTFGVLLIHANSDTMRRWLWRDTLDNIGAYQRGGVYFVLHAFFSTIIVHIICVVFDMLRIQLVEKPFFRWYEQKYK